MLFPLPVVVPRSTHTNTNAHTHTHTHLYTTADDFLMNRMCGVRKRETSRMTSYLF